ncbi:acyltransferase [Brevundimonas sp. NIBR10]|uniref:acyltransferase family protein n=1 Tax=Brevundimonas sp. NIBR10 TaxID=3015997 RepID=UPI0022F16A2B|nr:acyltransferase [Brevundimonas sp. NIBR10]
MLDALRGLCAVLVVFFHMPVASHFHALPLTRHGYLFVDFFFVLSGFVIAHAYGARLGRVADLWPFLVKRMGRVWPLHAVMLAAFVGLELCRLWFNIDAATPFVRDRSVEAIFTNLALIQAFNIHDYQTWNGPAWSISVEMGAYVLFAVLMVMARRWFVPISLAIIVVGGVTVVLLAPGFMNTTHNFGFPRAAYGFFLGCLVHRVWLWRPPTFSPAVASVLQAACLIWTGVWVSYATGPWTVLAPVVFAISIWIFAEERGLVARVLAVRPMLALGHWSYSIYMVHMFIITLMLIAARKMQLMPGGRRIDLGSLWLNDLLALAVIGVIVGVSVLTYRWVEVPGRDAVNGWLARRMAMARARAGTVAAAPGG